MKVLVLTSCVASKKYGIEEIKPLLDIHNLPIPTDNLENEERYKEILKEFVLPASQMYEGSFKFVKELVDTLRKRGDEVDFYIISARYGLIDENTPIIPYEYTFKGLSKEEIRKKADKLEIYNKLKDSIGKKNYDRAIIILGGNYLLTIFDRERRKNFFQVIKAEKMIIFGGKQLENYIKDYANVKLVPVNGIGDRNKKIKEFTVNIVQTKLA